uniref:NADH dehydrogenase subunit 6 n=1 Tax=Botrylloides giganteus TaxID=2034436 RepID=A0A024GWH5_9ASCI|nr:NADH dehydrogenase subunit 6 [Botrylloides giganteus]CCO25719.1 NADH dehydrogenase subunit 6 [Botrylloides giganteus]
MFFGLDLMSVALSGMIFFLFFVVFNSSYLFIIGGIIVYSVLIFLCMVWNGFVFLGLIFMMVYSGGLLLLVLYVSAMLGDYEVRGEQKKKFFLFLCYFVLLNLGEYEVFDYYGGFSYYSFGGVYLLFCVLCLGLSLCSILFLLLKKSF